MKRILVVLLCTTSAVFFAKSVKITFQVQVPRTFSLYPVYLTGSDTTLGAWVPNKIPMARQGNVFFATLSLPSDGAIEYKYTLGDWDHVETTATGEDIQNRTLQCDSDCTVQDQVANFNVTPFHPLPQTARPHVLYYHEFYFPELKNYRSVAIYLPPQYFTEPKERFPVLYALDGRNLFDTATRLTPGNEWGIDETLDKLLPKGGMPPFIVVGVYDTDRRTDEYLPCSVEGAGGLAQPYGEFLVHTVKPFIDSHFRTLRDRENTALLGSSFGGTFAVYASLVFPETFSRFIAMSPGLWWDEECTLDILKEKLPTLPEALRPKKLWIDMGDNETCTNPNFVHGIEEVDEAAALYERAGLVPEVSIAKRIIPGGMHNDESWGKRFAAAAQFIFSK